MVEAIYVSKESRSSHLISQYPLTSQLPTISLHSKLTTTERKNRLVAIVNNTNELWTFVMHEVFC